MYNAVDGGNDSDFVKIDNDVDVAEDNNVFELFVIIGFIIKYGLQWGKTTPNAYNIRLINFIIYVVHQNFILYL